MLKVTVFIGLVTNYGMSAYSITLFLMFINILIHRITIYLNENYITIQDNGIGFNDMSTKSKGLTIIKDICERFSLKLNIKSDSNGTIITIENNRE